MIRRPPRSTQSRSSAASDVYKRQGDGRVVLTALEQACDRRDGQDDHDERERLTDRDLRSATDRLPPVDERQLVDVRRVQDQLDADEREQDGQADAQIDQALEQTADEEVELAQTHQGEDVGGQHEEGLLGQTEDRRNRVQRKEQVGGAQGEDDDEHRRDDATPVLPDGQLG